MWCDFYLGLDWNCRAVKRSKWSFTMHHIKNLYALHLTKGCCQKLTWLCQISAEVTLFNTHLFVKVQKVGCYCVECKTSGGPRHCCLTNKTSSSMQQADHLQSGEGSQTSTWRIGFGAWRRRDSFCCWRLEWWWYLFEGTVCFLNCKYSIRRPKKNKA